MVTTAPARPVVAPPPEVEPRRGLRLSTATYQRRPWQIGSAWLWSSCAPQSPDRCSNPVLMIERLRAIASDV